MIQSAAHLTGLPFRDATRQKKYIGKVRVRRATAACCRVCCRASRYRAMSEPLFRGCPTCWHWICLCSGRAYRRSAESLAMTCADMLSALRSNARPLHTPECPANGQSLFALPHSPYRSPSGRADHGRTAFHGGGWERAPNADCLRDSPLYPQVFCRRLSNCHPSSIQTIITCGQFPRVMPTGITVVMVRYGAFDDRALGMMNPD